MRQELAGETPALPGRKKCFASRVVYLFLYRSQHLKPESFICRPVLLTAILSLASLSIHAAYEPANITPPKPAREFRAAWVATVGNIDWPSQKGLNTSEQKGELLAILDRAAQLNLNTIVFQVRPACDALYASSIEPWSEYLTGKMGEAPAPYYDPLTFAVEEAHKRGLELHAWFNPYRAGHPSAKSTPSANHITRTRPQLVRHYGKQIWLDPGEKDVQEYSLGVVMDVVRRYDIDGVHFDDYFYPYKETSGQGGELEFPDEPSWRRYAVRGKLNRDDWRRENVNSFIQQVYSSVKRAKPWVKFGVSPFGIWRPGNPPQIKGFDAYGKLYADSRKWLREGWVDYFAPQLYWSIESSEQSFPVLLKWWAGQNPKGRHILAGLDTTKTGRSERAGRPGWHNEEIINQIRLTRSQPSIDGHIHWNMKSLMRNSQLDEVLLEQVYSQPALVPASPWLGHAQLGQPALSIHDGEKQLLSWTLPAAAKPSLWVLQTLSGGAWKTELLPAAKTGVTLSSAPEVVAVSAVDRMGNMTTPAVLRRGSAANSPNPRRLQPKAVASPKNRG